MRVLLIQPPSHDPLTDRIFPFEPLALEYLVAGLKLDGHEVEIVDARLEPDIEGACRGFQPELVGLTGFTSHVNIVKGIAARLKELNSDVLTVVGGHHPTVCPEEFNEPNIDMVLIGEWGSTLRETIHAIESGSPLRKIKGLAIPCPDGMLFSEPRPCPGLNAFPSPTGR